MLMIKELIRARKLGLTIRELTTPSQIDAKKVTQGGNLTCQNHRQSYGSSPH
jgi:hypothetical protein